MASFVEQATLKVNDQSSAQIKKINAELKKLEQTAKSLKNIKVNITINEKGIQSALQKVKALQTAARQAGSSRINLNVNTSGLTRAQQQIQRLRQSAARPINVNTQHSGGGGGGGGGGRGANRGAPARGMRQTGLAYQMGNFSTLRGAASVVIGGTAYAVAANVARTAVEGVQGGEDARMRLRQSGFDKGRKDDLTPQIDYFVAAARKNQEIFTRIPAAEILDASVEQLNAIKANNGTREQYDAVLRRVASNAQELTTTYKDPTKGKEGARQLERLSQNLGQDVDEAKIAKIHDAAIRAVVATGGEMGIDEMVRVTQQLGSGIAKNMSPQALLDIFMIREEGGRASTAEWRTAIQALGKGEINKKDKAAQIKYGLRDKSGRSIPAITDAASSNFVQFTEDKIRPILRAAGKEFASSMDIANWLDEVAGFSTTSARAYADVITSMNNNDLQRQRAAAGYVDRDPHLGDRTFRGGTETLGASLQTGMARALDKSGGAFADATKPFAVAMDKAGKAAEKGNYAESAFEMTKGVSQMMGGPAGAIITAMTAASAARTLIDPTSTPMEKAAAMLTTGASTLMTAAGAIANYFGKGDPVADLTHLEQVKRQTPDEIENLKSRIAAEAAKETPNKDTLNRLRISLEGAERQARTIDGDIAAAKARVDAAKKDADNIKIDEAAYLQRMWEAAGLQPTATAATAAAAGPISVETVKALQQLNAGGGLAGVNSITALLKALNQPTSVKAREELAKGLGYTGPLGGSAQMNTFLLNFLKKLAAQPPEEPKPVVAPPPPVEVKPVEEPKPVVVEPPKAPVPIEQPVVVTPSEQITPPAGTLPGGGPKLIPRPETSPGGLRPIKPLTPFSDLVDMEPAKVQFASLFTSGATTIGSSGSEVGMNAAAELYGEASGIGQTIGAAAAAIISSATVNVNIPNAASKPASTGSLSI